MARLSVRLACLSGWVILGSACSAPTPEELLADARVALATGETRTAEIHLKNLLQQDPANATARLLLGGVAATTGDFRAAEQSLRRAVQLGADPAEAQLLLVRALIAQGKRNEALEQIATGPTLAGADQIALLTLQGAAYRGLGDRDRAESAYRSALALDPRSSSVRTELAGLLIESGRTRDAKTIIDGLLAEDPRFAPALLLRGRLESSSGQNAAAEATLQQAVELERANAVRSPTYAVGLAQLVEVQLAQGKLDEAVANSDALLALNANNPIARYMKAAVEVQQKNLDGAEQRLESVVAEFPEYWPAHRMLGAINMSQNQPRQALMYLRTAVNNNPSDGAARTQLAELYIHEGDVEAAKKLMESAPSAAVSDGLFFAFAGRVSQRAGVDEQAARYFDRSEQQTLTDARQLVDVSNMYMSAGEFERAVRVLQSASLDDPQGKQLQDYLLALIQVRQGNVQAAAASAQRLIEQQPGVAWPLNLGSSIAVINGDFPRARALAEKALAIEPQSTAALMTLARVAAAEKDPREAEGYLRRVIEARPGEASALLGLTQLAAARGDFEAARSWIEKLPSSPARQVLEADLLNAQGRFDVAAAAYAKAYSAQPSLEVALRAYGAATRAGRSDADAQLLAWSASNPNDAGGNFALGAVALNRGQADESVRRYEAVLAVNPQHAASLNNLAWLYGQSGDARALDFAERALAVDPNNPSIADTLGWLHVQRGDAAQGLPLLERATNALPGQAEVRYHWAVALADTGDSARALEVLRTVVANGGNFPGRPDAEKRVGELERQPR